MKVIVCEDYEAASQKAAEIFADRIKANPSIVIGLATGSTPERLYALLAEKNKAGEIDFSNVKTFNLDEYAGLEPTHDQSYRAFMNDKLFDHINIDKNNTNVLAGAVDDLDAECAGFEQRIKDAGGIDLQLLGIGGNGHIAFNEPGSPKDSLTRVVDLDDATIEDNSRFFASANEVPKQALSMGMASIMSAKEIVLIANKENKADALAKSLEEPVTEDIPASILQDHPNVTFIVDKPAASRLQKDYGCNCGCG